MLTQVRLIVKRGVGFVRNVFCFKAAEHRFDKSETYITPFGMHSNKDSNKIGEIILGFCAGIFAAIGILTIVGRLLR
jgi:hypothetical protein